MTRPRRDCISVTDTPYYHCVARCVRRAFLCGHDLQNDRDHSHRREWVLDRMRLLSDMFAIRVCAYAIMSNHYHLVLKIDSTAARSWTAEEVVDRWQILFTGPDLVHRFRSGRAMHRSEADKAMEIIERWRQRLCDISWYMRVLNEHIARLANAEDECTGRFWEGRFKSQALLDEQALLTCMAYVDLNPIRAQMADSLEGSDFTSIQQRIRDYANPRKAESRPNPPVDFIKSESENQKIDIPCPLLELTGGDGQRTGIPFDVESYLHLVDWAGRQVRPDKRGFITGDTPSILSSLEIDEDAFLRFVSPKVKRSPVPAALGKAESLQAMAAAFGRKFFRGAGCVKKIFQSSPAFT